MLKLNRDLLNPNFKGYKVSMKGLPVFKTILEEKSFSRSLPNSMVSLAHFKNLRELNSIFADFQKRKLYRISEYGGVQQILFDSQLKTFSNSTIAKIDLKSPETPGYPPNLLFTSHDLIVASNGISEICVFLETGGKEWMEMLKIEIPIQNDAGICLIEARADEKRENLHILASRIENDEKSESSRTRLYWITVGLEDLDFAKVLKIKSQKEILLPGSFETATLVESEQQLMVISSESPKFSENSGDFKQFGNKIEMEFEIFHEISEESVEFHISKRSIFLAVDHDVLLKGTLFGEIKNAVEICWDPDSHKLSLKLEKLTENSWDRLLECENAENQQKIEKRGFGAPESLEEQDICGAVDEYSEECDESETAQFIWYLDCENQKILRKFDISGHQILFTRRNNLTPAEICLRFDVDGIIWKFNGAQPEHLATLLAFGYVQASKVQRIWSGASTDNKFGAIVEANRLLIYSQNLAIDGSLLKVGHIAEQHLLRLETSEKICGFQILDNMIFVATKSEIHVLEGPSRFSFLQMQQDLRLSVIDDMDPIDRCRFASASWTCSQEAKTAKNYLYGMELHIRDEEYITINIVYKEEANQTFGFSIQFVKTCDGNTLIYRSLPTDLEIRKEPLDESIHLTELAISEFNELLEKHHHVLKKLVINGDYEHGRINIPRLRNLENFETTSNRMSFEVLSNATRPLNSYTFWGDDNQREFLVNEKLFEVLGTIVIFGARIGKEDFEKLQAANMDLNIADLQVEDVLKFIRKWKNKEAHQHLMQCAWHLGGSDLSIEALFRLLGTDENNINEILVEQEGTDGRKAIVCRHIEGGDDILKFIVQN